MFKLFRIKLNSKVDIAQSHDTSSSVARMQPQMSKGITDLLLF